MNNNAFDSTQAATLRRWRRVAILAALMSVVSITLMAGAAFLATQSLTTHYNLYYLLWKAGVRPYERPVAFGGLYHDEAGKRRFIGMTAEEFEAAFPNTFYKVRKHPPQAKPNQEFYIDDYQQARREDGNFGFCWLAIFENGRLIELEVSKPL